MSIDMPSIGVISHIMPLSVILQVIMHIMTGIGIPPPIPIIGFIIGIMPFIMPIMGFMPIIDIIGFIMGIGILASVMAGIALSVGIGQRQAACEATPL